MNRNTDCSNVNALESASSMYMEPVAQHAVETLNAGVPWRPSIIVGQIGSAASQVAGGSRDKMALRLQRWHPMEEPNVRAASKCKAEAPHADRPRQSCQTVNDISSCVKVTFLAHPRPVATRRTWMEPQILPSTNRSTPTIASCSPTFRDEIVSSTEAHRQLEASDSKNFSHEDLTLDLKQPLISQNDLQNASNSSPSRETAHTRMQTDPPSSSPSARPVTIFTASASDQLQRI